MPPGTARQATNSRALRGGLYVRVPEAALLRHAAYRVCNFVRSAHLPLAGSVLRNLLEDVGIRLTRRQVDALCQALEAAGQLSLHAGRINRHGPGPQSAQALDGDAVALRVQALLLQGAAAREQRKVEAQRFAKLSSVFELGTRCLPAKD